MALTSATGATSALYKYSSDKEFLAVVQRIADAQRITVWKTASATVIVDHTPPERTVVTSIAWGNLKTSKKQVTPLLAICLSNGQVQLLSALNGAIHATLTGSHTLAVNDFVFLPNSGVGYSCGQDSWIVRWNLANGTSETKFKLTGTVQPKKLCISPNLKYLVAADASVTILDIQSHKELAKFSAHASGITHVEFTRDSHVLLTCALDDRFVNAYDLTNVANGTTQPLPALSQDTTVSTFAISQTTEVGQVAVLGSNGTLSLWSSARPAVESGANAKKRARRAKFSARTPDTQLNIKSKETGEPLPITSCAFAEAPQAHLIFTRGNSLNPTFESMVYLQNDELIPSETLVRAEQAAFYDGRNASAVLKRQEYKEPQSAETVHAADMVKAAPSLAAHRSTEEELETLSDRVAKLQALPAVASTNAQNGHANGISLDVTSLHITLTQALHSNDTDLLESVLSAPSLTPAAINNTVRKLPSSHVVTFLNVLVDRFQRRHTRAPQLLHWIRALIIAHCGFLLTVPDLVRKLSTFYHVLESRVDNGKKLLKLQGRLELVLSQMELRQKASALPQEDGPMVVVDEDDDADEDAQYEDMAHPSARAMNTLRPVQRRAKSSTLEALGNDINGADGTPSDSEDVMAVDGEMNGSPDAASDSDDNGSEEEEDASDDDDEMQGLESSDEE